MLGIRDIHEYFQCGKCECLQLTEIPEDIEKYYPRDYYSYTQVEFPKGFKKYLTTKRDHYAATGRGILGRWLSSRHPQKKLESLRPANVNRKTRILDVGCGAGHLLYSLQEAGFKNLLGIDPFNDGNIKYGNGLQIQKKSIIELADEGNQEWDVIMFNHSFEHIEEQRETMLAIAKLLPLDGMCIIRVPTVSSWAWHHYDTDWVQLDAPRHLFLHSEKSMYTLAEFAYLKLENIVCDSFALQFWGSEQYAHDIPLQDERSYAVNPANSMFSEKDIKEFEKRAEELNKQHEGDQVAFYLRRK
jgi:2-polyprenyl-3-methyl-5-hydroxy-6-metoxy-1,4-benzoquinol methylase